MDDVTADMLEPVPGCKSFRVRRPGPKPKPGRGTKGAYPVIEIVGPRYAADIRKGRDHVS